MILLRLISWPDARKHVLRTLLTMAGIVLGIAVFVGVNTANRSVLASFQQTVDQIAGKTQLQVSAGECGFPEEVLEKVQSLERGRGSGAGDRSSGGHRTQGTRQSSDPRGRYDR